MAFELVESYLPDWDKQTVDVVDVNQIGDMTEDTTYIGSNDDLDSSSYPDVQLESPIVSDLDGGHQDEVKSTMTMEPSTTGKNVFDGKQKDKQIADILMTMAGIISEDDTTSSSSFSVETGIPEATALDQATSVAELSATLTTAASEYTEYTEPWDSTSMATSSTLPYFETNVNGIADSSIWSRASSASSTATDESEDPSSTIAEEEETLLPAAFTDISISPWTATHSASSSAVAYSASSSAVAYSASSSAVAYSASSSAVPYSASSSAVAKSASSSAVILLASSLSFAGQAKEAPTPNPPGPAPPPPGPGKPTTPPDVPSPGQPDKPGPSDVPSPGQPDKPGPSHPPNGNTPNPSGQPGGAPGNGGGGNGGRGSPGIDYAGPNSVAAGRNHGSPENLGTIGEIGVFESMATSQYHPLGTVWMWIAALWVVWMTMKYRH
ncbi:hypothetical protein BGW37DRAFT_555370 [Umbelopsis sp. PMI_123]|nr:hypothetical protein BGW37DRAFT_555370 [Umbelopsis sp. PMI_123]